MERSQTPASSNRVTVQQPTAEQIETGRRAEMWQKIRQQIGPRYSRCDFDSYKCRSDEQQRAKDSVVQYMGLWPEHSAEGRGLLLYGPAGTGKDHLAIAALKVAVRDFGASPAWIDGQTFFGMIRDKIGTELGEGAALRPYTSADVLVISDPLPMEGKPTEFQQGLLWRIVDRRYRDLRPTWVTMNVSGSAEAQARLGVQLVDRIRHGATVVSCNWATHRVPGQVVSPAKAAGTKGQQ